MRRDERVVSVKDVYKPVWDRIDQAASERGASVSQIVNERLALLDGNQDVPGALEKVAASDLTREELLAMDTAKFVPLTKLARDIMDAEETRARAKTEAESRILDPRDVEWRMKSLGETRAQAVEYFKALGQVEPAEVKEAEP